MELLEKERREIQHEVFLKGMKEDVSDDLTRPDTMIVSGDSLGDLFTDQGLLKLYARAVNKIVIEGYLLN